MEKEILLDMRSNKDIVVSVNGEEKMKVESNSRNIKANQLYDLLNYSKNDTYVIKTRNEHNVDIPVLDFFDSLIKDIVDKLNPNE